MMRLLLFVLFAGLLCFSVRDLFSHVEKSRRESTANLIAEKFSPEKEFTFTDSQQLVWTLTPTEALPETQVVYFDKFPSGFVALSQSDYSQVLQLQARRVCPANFVNSKVRFFVIYTDQKEMIDLLQKLQRGTPVTLAGHRLKYRVKTAKDLPVDFSYPSNTDLVYVSSLKVK